MFMRLETVTLEGVSCFCHRLQKVVITEAGQILAVVHSYVDVDSPKAVFSDAYELPASAFPDNVVNEQTAMLHLISSGQFTGATLGVD